LVLPLLREAAESAGSGPPGSPRRPLLHSQPIGSLFWWAVIYFVTLHQLENVGGEGPVALRDLKRAEALFVVKAF